MPPEMLIGCLQHAVSVQFLRLQEGLGLISIPIDRYISEPTTPSPCAISDVLHVLQ